MQITKVQKQKNGYLVNDSMSVPIAQDNSDYQAVQKWIADGGVVEAFDALAEAKLTKIAQCQTYLESTDWQAAAFIKYGRTIDANVSKNCLKAKQWKIDIAACTTLEELNAININFE
jgi:hypothetical protein